MQMESDFLPFYAGEWFIKQIKFFNEYKNTKIIIISATSNIRQIAKNIPLITSQNIGVMI